MTDCLHCGHPNDASCPVIRVVDEFGSTDLCGLGVLQLLAQAGRDLQVTVLVDRPHITARTA